MGVLHPKNKILIFFFALLCHRVFNSPPKKTEPQSQNKKFCSFAWCHGWTQKSFKCELGSLRYWMNASFMEVIGGNTGWAVTRMDIGYRPISAILKISIYRVRKKHRKTSALSGGVILFPPWFLVPDITKLGNSRIWKKSIDVIKLGVQHQIRNHPPKLQNINPKIFKIAQNISK